MWTAQEASGCHKCQCCPHYDHNLLVSGSGARRRNIVNLYYSSASTVRAAEAIAVSVHSRYCSNGDSRDYIRLKSGGPIFRTEKFVGSTSFLVNDNLTKFEDNNSFCTQVAVLICS